jgi:hypothetical protein
MIEYIFETSRSSGDNLFFEISRSSRRKTVSIRHQKKNAKIE